jgi:acyl-homoserine lactone acylase PvdQ
VKAHFPRYMDQVGENERGRHALLLLTGKKGWTHESLRAAAFDSFLPGFARLLPVLMADYDHLPSGDARRAALAGAITLLRGWDRRWGLESTPTTLAVFWGDTLWAQVGAKARAEHRAVPDYIIARCTAQERLAALQAAVDRLKRDFGDWHVAWGRVNRFQRLDDRSRLISTMRGPACRWPLPRRSGDRWPPSGRVPIRTRITITGPAGTALSPSWSLARR